MNTKLQLFLDKYIARSLAFGLNFIVRILGKILRINHQLDREYKTIVVSKFKGMGSILQATPMLVAIKQRYPDAELVFVSTSSNKQILELLPMVGKVLCVNDKGLLKFAKTNLQVLWYLIRKRPEIYFDLEIYSDYSTLFTLFSLSINRVGFYLRSSSFRMGIYTHMMFFNPKVSIAEVYLQMARLIGCEVSKSTLVHLQSSYTDSELGENYFVINPNASDLRLERRWGRHNFALLIQGLIKKYPQRKIVIIGSKDERKYTDKIIVQLTDTSKQVINLAGKTNIYQLVGVVANCGLMITNDTGPMHIAFCTRTPVISLFGPCSPEQYGVSENCYAIYKPVYCSPCVHDFEIPPCGGDNSCMKIIEVNEVMEKIESILSGVQKSPHSRANRFIYSYEHKILGKVNR